MTKYWEKYYQASIGLFGDIVRFGNLDDLPNILDQYQAEYLGLSDFNNLY